jgi:hypothetical protein
MKVACKMPPYILKGVPNNVIKKIFSPSLTPTRESGNPNTNVIPDLIGNPVFYFVISWNWPMSKVTPALSHIFAGECQ